MGAPLRTTRRDLFRLALPMLLPGRPAAASVPFRSLDVDRIASQSVSGTHAVQFRRYRVRAAVSIFSIPLFSKDDIGAACLMAEGSESGSSQTTAIQFACGSWPDRIDGFNRFGMTQEVVHEVNGVVVESAYLCFMTSSPERNQDQAWRAFVDPSRVLNLALARGAATPASYRWTLEHVPAPAGTTWVDFPLLMETLRSAAPGTPEFAANERADRAFPTFLHAVRKAMACGCPRSRCTFMHNAKLYDLQTSMSPAGAMMLLTGHIVEQDSRSQSEFRVWFAPSDASGLPFRIEFRPRSFLRLVFEQDMAAGGPTPRNLIPRENA